MQFAHAGTRTDACRGTQLRAQKTLRMLYSIRMCGRIHHPTKGVSRKDQILMVSEMGKGKADSRRISSISHDCQLRLGRQAPRCDRHRQGKERKDATGWESRRPRCEHPKDMLASTGPPAECPLDSSPVIGCDPHSLEQCTGITPRRVM